MREVKKKETAKLTQSGFWRTDKKRSKNRLYHRTITGIAAHLRANRGYLYEDSIVLAGILTNRLTRCTICGIPVYWLRIMKRWARGSERMNRRLSADHIDPRGPSTLVNTRPLCYSCNCIRGHAELTDEEVLREMTFWYTREFTPRYLWWLNTSPGQGGRLHRSTFSERDDRRYGGSNQTDSHRE